MRKRCWKITNLRYMSNEILSSSLFLPWWTWKPYVSRTYNFKRKKKSRFVSNLLIVNVVHTCACTTWVQAKFGLQVACLQLLFYNKSNLNVISLELSWPTYQTKLHLHLIHTSIITSYYIIVICLPESSASQWAAWR